MRRLILLLCAALLAIGVSLPTPVLAAPGGLTDVPLTIIAPASGQLVIYMRSATSSTHPFRKTWNGSAWSSWGLTGLQDTPITMPSNAAPISPSETAAFSQLSNRSLWCGATGLPWVQFDTFDYMNSAAAATPATLNTGGGFYFVLGVRGNNHVWRSTWRAAFTSSGCDTSTISGIRDTLGGTNYTPAIAGTSTADFLMAVMGTDGHFWWSYNDGSWNQNSGGGSGAVALTTWGGGRYDAFIRGGDGALWHTADPNGAWESLAGGLQSGPACAAWAANRIDCVVIGNDFNVWHISWNGANWSNWENLLSA